MTVKTSGSGSGAPGRVPSGTVNPVTGKSSPGPGYAPSTVVHSETVLRTFYDFHLETGAGPLVNPFPLARRAGGVNAHHNPMQAWSGQRVGRYRPRVPARIPRGVPDEMFDELFARLSCDRDRALLAFWISSGVRASELLGMRVRDVDAGRQLITVVRKGSRAVQQVPASPDAFVTCASTRRRCVAWCRPGGTPVWWTLRRPLRALAYHGAHLMFERVNAMLGSDWTLHDLRHVVSLLCGRVRAEVRCASGEGRPLACP